MGASSRPEAGRQAACHSAARGRGRIKRLIQAPDIPIMMKRVGVQKVLKRTPIIRSFRAARAPLRQASFKHAFS